jgi:hypothetical protein
MKKRIAGIAALAGVIAVAVGMPGVGASAPNRDFTGKPCMDVFVTADYTGTLNDQATVTGTLQLKSAPSCAGAVYTVYVVDGGTQTVSFVGDGVKDVYSYSVAVANAPATICVYATSRPNSKSNSVADTAPDGACSDPLEPIVLNGGTGASGMG